MCVRGVRVGGVGGRSGGRGAVREVSRGGCGLVWSGLEWSGVVWCGVEWSGVVLCCVVWSGDVM